MLILGLFSIILHKTIFCGYLASANLIGNHSISFIIGEKLILHSFLAGI